MHESTIPAEAESLRAELNNSQNERMRLSAQLAQIIEERNKARSELKHTEQIIEAARLKSALADDLEIEVAALRHELNVERLKRAAIEESRSWRLILKLRKLLNKMGRRP
jgi:long-subunit acyl-CoA synthetase (AMP-forming)